MYECLQRRRDVRDNLLVTSKDQDHAQAQRSRLRTEVSRRWRGRLHFMGCVKTAHRMFPKDYFNNWAAAPHILRGSHKTLTTTMRLEDNQREAQVIGVAWKDLKTKMIISTRGITSVQGNPSVRHCRRVVETDWGRENDQYELAIPRPQLIEMFYSCFSNIDVHDHYRQGSLAMETHWTTRTWWHRLDATLFGMIATDAFLGYRLEYGHRNQGSFAGMQTYKKFLHKLAYQLIFGANEPNARRRAREEEEVEGVPQPGAHVSMIFDRKFEFEYFLIFLYFSCFYVYKCAGTPNVAVNQSPLL
jgi:hypothetical protein